MHEKAMITQVLMKSESNLTKALYMPVTTIIINYIMDFNTVVMEST